MTPEQINYFRTFGFFLSRKLLSLEEIELLSRAFDLAMKKARGGALKPGPGEKRQQVIPFFDYDPDAFSLSWTTREFWIPSSNSSGKISS